MSLYPLYRNKDIKICETHVIETIFLYIFHRPRDNAGKNFPLSVHRSIRMGKRLQNHRSYRLPLSCALTLSDSQAFRWVGERLQNRRSYRLPLSCALRLSGSQALRWVGERLQNQRSYRLPLSCALRLSSSQKIQMIILILGCLRETTTTAAPPTTNHHCSFFSCSSSLFSTFSSPTSSSSCLHRKSKTGKLKIVNRHMRI